MWGGAAYAEHVRCLFDFVLLRSSTIVLGFFLFLCFFRRLDIGFDNSNNHNKKGV